MIRFDDFELDLEKLELRRGGRPVELQLKALDLLAYLVRRRERVVSRQELLDAHWPDVVVGESVLTQAVWLVRRALGERSGASRYLRTVRGRGYQFVGQLDEEPSIDSAAQFTATEPSETAPPSSSEHPTRSDSPFIGRETELAELAQLAQQVNRGSGTFVLVSGEPGVGKTRLLAELEQPAGMLRLEARCDEHSDQPPFWPWIQLLRELVQHHDPATVREAMAAGASDVVQLVPAAARLAPDALPGTKLDLAGERFRLFDSVVLFLRHLCAKQPLLAVIEDLQLADDSSLSLLRFVTRQLQHSRLLLLATARQSALTRRPTLAALAGELRRDGDARLVALAPLDAAPARRLARVLLGESASTGLVEGLVARSQGNPFFLRELVAQWHARPAEGLSEASPSAELATMALPASVQHTIQGIVERLSSPCQRLLDAAAVAGRSFSLAALDALASLPSEQLLTAVDEACAAGIVAWDTREAHRLRFSHLLFKEVIEARQSTQQLASFHAHAARRLEAIAEAASPSGSLLTRLAHHFSGAIPLLGAERALHFTLRAADWSLDHMAPERAVQLYERALALFAQLERAEPPSHCRCLLSLGQAYHYGGVAARARETFVEAAASARRISEPKLFARAALGAGLTPGLPFSIGAADPDLAALLEQAIDALEQVPAGRERDALRAQLVTRLAFASLGAGETTRASALGDEALAIARQTDDSQVLAYALCARFFALNTADQLDERAAMARQLDALAKQGAAVEIVFWMQHFSLVEALGRGELDVVSDELVALRQMAHAARLPHAAQVDHAWQATLLTACGAFAQAERQLQLLETLDQQARPTIDGAEVAQTHLVQLWLLRLLQGRAGEVLQPLQEATASHPQISGWRCVLAHTLAQCGEQERAHAMYRELMRDGCAAVMTDRVAWMTSLATLSLLAERFADREGAEQLYRLLLPHDAAHVVVAFGSGYMGPVNRYLAINAFTLGDEVGASRHLRKACAQLERTKASPWQSLVAQDTQRLTRSVASA